MIERADTEREHRPQHDSQQTESIEIGKTAPASKRGGDSIGREGEPQSGKPYVQKQERWPDFVSHGEGTILLCRFGSSVGVPDDSRRDGRRLNRGARSTPEVEGTFPTQRVQVH